MKIKGVLRWLGIIFSVLVMLALVVPFLIPVPPLENTCAGYLLHPPDFLGF